jgi:putative endonuclease
MGDRRRRVGALGERIAGRHLEARGYELLDRNFRTRYGEIDIVASGRGALVFCEVKTRVEGAAGAFAPLASVGPRKQRQLRRMAAQWLADGARPRAAGGREIRFDAIGVTLDPSGRLLSLDHVENAF